MISKIKHTKLELNFVHFSRLMKSLSSFLVMKFLIVVLMVASAPPTLSLASKPLAIGSAALYGAPPPAPLIHLRGSPPPPVKLSIRSYPAPAPLYTESAPLYTESAPLYTESAPILDVHSPLLAEHGPLLAEHGAVLAEQGSLLAQQAPYLGENSALCGGQLHAPLLEAPLEASGTLSEQYLGTPVLSAHAPLLVKQFAAPVITKTPVYAKTLGAPILTKMFASPLIGKTYAVPSELGRTIYSGPTLKSLYKV